MRPSTRSIAERRYPSPPWREGEGRGLAREEWGTVPYADAVARMDALFEARRQGDAPDTLLLLEHPHVLTLSPRTPEAHLLLDRTALAERGVTVAPTRRGGDVTYHGPGQLIAWPVLDLNPDRRDVRAHVRLLEQVMIDVLADYGIEARRDDEHVGVWVGNGAASTKIGAIGVHISRWITRHGFALNVNTDLSYFSLIVPCGIADRGVSSMQSLLGQAVDPAEVRDRVFGHFLSALGAHPLDAQQPLRSV